MRENYCVVNIQLGGLSAGELPECLMDMFLKIFRPKQFVKLTG
jgi:hypothetical protein